MAPPVARLGSSRPAPSIPLLRFLRQCAFDSRQSTNSHGAQRQAHTLTRSQPTRDCVRSLHNGTQAHVTRSFLQQFKPAKQSRSWRCPRSKDTGLVRTISSSSRSAGAAVAVQISDSDLESLVELEEPKRLVEDDGDQSADDSIGRATEDSIGLPELVPCTTTIATRHASQTTLFSHQPREGPRITRYFTEEKAKTRHFPLKMAEDVLKEVAHLETLLCNEQTSADSVYRAYKGIPQPRLAHITQYTLRGVLRALRDSRIKTPEAAQRYLSVLDDMVQFKIVPTQRDLNSALTFAGRMADIRPRLALEKALNLYRRLESHGKRAPDLVTFNTLGDLALRAGNFELFTKLLQEMRERGIAHDRYTGMLKLRYWGILGNAGQVRRTYRDMVAAGEIVETVTFNCVIQYLIVAGDAFTAEKTFERMKEIDDQKQPRERLRAPVAWKEQKKLSRILSYATWYYRGDTLNLRRMQSATPTGPNTHTYRMIIRHHCFTTKNLLRIIDLLEEMPQRGLFITRPIFYMIFAAFSKNRATKFSPWNLLHLEGVFDLFVKYIELQNEGDKIPAIDRNEPDKYDDRCDFNGRTVEAILEAYAEHAEVTRLRQVWEQIRDTWKAAPTTKVYMEELVSSVENAGERFLSPSKRPAYSVKENAERTQRIKRWNKDDEEYRRAEHSQED